MSILKKTVSLVFVTFLVTMGIDAHNGQATYYDPGVGYSACGTLHGTYDFVCAMNAPQFDPNTPNGNPNNNYLCHRRIQVNGPGGSVVVAVVDRCPVCQYGDIDLSPSAFQHINHGSLDAGRVNINWHWV